MGKAPHKRPQAASPLAKDARKAAEHLRQNPLKLRDLTFTPLGPLATHFLFVKRRGQPHQKDTVLSGTVARDDDSTRVGLPDIDLAKKVAPGTPDPHRPSARNTIVTRLENPLFQIDDKTGSLRGVARLSIDDPQYPQGLVDPTVLQLYISSDPLHLMVDDPLNPKFNISATYGPIQTDLKLKLKFDPGDLSRAGVVKAIAGGDPTKFIERLSGPGFDLSGLVQFSLIKNIPVLNRLLMTKISLSSPSTTPIEKPISTAPTNRAFDMRLFGIIPVPAGAIFETQSLGYGITGQSWNSSSGSSYSVAGIAVPSPTKLSEVSLYLYVNYYKVWKVADGWELSVNLNFSPSKVVGGGDKTEKDLQLQWKEAADRSWLPASGNFVHAGEKPTLFGEAKIKYTF